MKALNLLCLISEEGSGGNSLLKSSWVLLPFPQFNEGSCVLPSPQQTTTSLLEPTALSTTGDVAVVIITQELFHLFSLPPL